MKHVIDAYQDRPLVKVKDRNFIINPLFDQQPATTWEMLDDTIEELSKLTDFSLATKILGEEDRGGFLSVLMAYRHRKPFGMVKWNPTGYEGQIAIDFRNAYTDGRLYFNGIDPGDKVILVEDMVDSGGTLIAMINALRQNNVTILDVLCVSEKEEFHGVDLIERETGIYVKHLVKVNCEGERSRVTWAYGQE